MSKDHLFRAAKTASLVAALALVAQSEWALALAVGWPTWIAWAAPLALDAYVLAAITAHKDLGPSVVVSAASVFGSHAVYAAPAAWDGGVADQGGNHLVWQLAAACSVVPLLVTWRVHHLRLAEAGPVDAEDDDHGGGEVAPRLEVQPDAPTEVGIPAPGSKSPTRNLEPPAADQSRPGKPVTVPDDDLAAIIRRVLTDKPEAGYGKVTAAIEDGGWLVGNTGRVKDAIRQHKAHRGLTVLNGTRG